MRRGELDEVVKEFEGSDLGDARLDVRLQRVVRQLAADPASSFPEATSSVADREALYRFCSNERVTLEGLVAPHVLQTRRRIERETVIRVVHDTTCFVFPGQREGMGPIHRKGQGFFAHCALAVGDDERRRPLGLLGVETYANTEASKRKGMTQSQQVAYWRAQPREQKRRSRWERLAKVTNALLPPGVEAVHVMDQEADDFIVFAELSKQQLRFVVRASGNRVTALAKESIRDALSQEQGTVFRTVQLNARPPRKAARKSRPARNVRDAHLHLRWARVELPRTHEARELEIRSLHVNVVHVYEPNPPDGEAGVEWFLVTNEPVANLEDAIRVVDHYRARWTVEEFFKALKTGCAIEKRQLETYDALVRVLGLYLPIAWRLLALRALSRESEPAPASELFSDEELQLIRVLVAQRRTDHSLPKSLDIRDVMLAIAAIGGHIPNNGDPGWLVLGRGFQRFVDALPVWTAARCDQS